MPKSLAFAKLATTTTKSAQAKKTLGDLLGDGQVKLGKTVLSERAQKERELEIFAKAAQDEARLRRYKKAR
jgi:ATP-dependent protease HslVU (ClpYQ) peptidase subunit